ncbi:MAG: Calx-beta domain-containing protein [Rikenellaceae bacterium]
MKRILKNISIVASVALMATSCNLNEFPTFNDDDAFVAFDSTSVSVSETKGSVIIPITLASVEGIETTIAYTATDGTAVAGVNYDLADPTGILSFDSETRTAYIEMSIYNLEGEFTGDLSFTIDITNTGSVDAGASSTCTVTITDEDHPLAAIIGTYYTAPDSYFYGTAYTWNFTLSKDETDTSLVWITGLVDYDDVFYGTVSDDKTELYVPLGQTAVSIYYSGYGPFTLYGCDADVNVVTSGNMVFKIDYSGSAITLTSEDMGPAVTMGGDYEGYYWDVILPPFSGVKID